MGIANIITLLGGVSLFLFGMTLMGDGLKKVAGNKLEILLWKLTNTPVKGILLGTVVTAIIQSSSATTVMVVGFVNSGMMKVIQSIGIIMGANIGTSITGWIMCLSYIDTGSDAGSIAALLSTATLSAVIAVIGIILRMFCKKATYRHIGDILLGFSVLMFGMQQMSGAVSPLRENQMFLDAIVAFKNPFLGILIGILVTAVIQSCSASIGILQALTVTGAITFETALPMIMGMGIGAATPVLLSAIGTNTNGKRTAFMYLINDLFGTIIVSVIFYTANAFLHFSFLDMTMTPVNIAIVNTVFRTVIMLILSPFIPKLDKLLCILFKDSPEDLEDARDIDMLEDRLINHPAIAIEQSRQAVIAMAKKARKNLLRAISLLQEYDKKTFEKVYRKEDVLDLYEDKLGSYLVKLTAVELSESQSRDISLILHTIGDFERIGDHAINIADLASEIHDKHIKFSKDALSELKILRNSVSEILDMSINAYIENDINKAFLVEPLEEVIDNLCYELKARHVNRIQSGNCTLTNGFVFNDLVTNYERIADYCSNIAVALIELRSDTFATHEYTNTLKHGNAEFNKYFEQYKKSYKL